MRAVVCTDHGSPELLTIVDVPGPTPAPGEVVVAVAFAALNFPDLLIIADQYQVSVPTPFTPGSEFAGVVVATGTDVRSVAVGERVFGSVFHGAFATHVVVPADALRAVPDSVGLDAAAGFWVAYATAYHSLRSVAEVRPGELVVVLGAAGGVGLAAVEVAHALGATVIAAASSDERLAICRERGAAHGVNYAAADLRDALRAVAPNGVDVVIDPVGGPYAERALRAMRWGGRFVTVGYASGEIPRIPLNLVLLKGVTIKGFEIRTFSELAPDAAKRDEAELMALFAAGRLAPHISSVHPLDEIAAALAEVASRRSTGKVLLAI
jgi:NADPH2:quinone reductase